MMNQSKFIHFLSAMSVVNILFDGNHLLRLIKHLYAYHKKYFFCAFVMVKFNDFKLLLHSIILK